MKRILCPHHNESTPSLVIYPNGNEVCYGCGYKKIVNGEIKEKKQEDIDKSIEYIESLPKELIRGLYLPFDGKYYYIKWTNGKYYKKRSTEDSSQKYRSPVGITKPLYIPVNKFEKNTIVIVEGELNALSLATSTGISPYTIVSPGSAGDLCRDSYIHYYREFNNACIIVDKDPAGARFGLDLKNKLKSLGMRVTLYLMEEDFNDLLVQHGKEKVKEEFNRALGVLKMQARENVRRTGGTNA